MRKGDWILICIVVAAALILWAVFAATPPTAGGQAVVRVDGKIVSTLDLNKDDTYQITGAKYPCTVTVQGGQVAITKAPCPDQICVNTGFISQANRSIVCLPNKLSITIENTTGGLDIDTVSY